MKVIARFLKSIWIFSFLRRIFNASKYFNGKYVQILKWGISSREFTNYTYDLTKGNMDYLAHTLAVITKSPYEKVHAYFEELRLDKELSDTILQAIAHSKEKRFADKQISFGRRYGWYALARILKPEIIIETGVDKGLGSILLCSALLRNKAEGYSGKFYGTDINPKAGYLLQGKYKEVGEILYGDSIESLSSFTHKIGLFINDSDHSADYEYKEYQSIKHLLTDNCIILGDNAHVSDKLAKFSLETNRHFIFFQEKPNDHWYPGAGIGISFT